MQTVPCPYCGHPQEYLSLKQAARLLGKSHPTMLNWIRQGRFPGSVKIPGVTAPYIYKIPVESVLPLVQDNDEAKT
jgi:predicted DNA-binding transcriptional regulator AlpA